jgi:hypothetical protein
MENILSTSRCQDGVWHRNSSNKAFASCKSGVSNPSVNQL